MTLTLGSKACYYEQFEDGASSQGNLNMLLLPHVVCDGITSYYVAVCKKLAVEGKVCN